MVRSVKACIAGLVFSTIVGTTSAAEICARAPDFTALQVSALQQQLMVAALTCNESALYNRFVLAYRTELIDYDSALKRFFEQFGDGDAASLYHSFKTKMANLYSARSGDDRRTFCAAVRGAFTPAISNGRKDLASFALSQPSFLDESYTNCGVSVAGAAGQAPSQKVAGQPQDATASSTGAASVNGKATVDSTTKSIARTTAPTVGRDGPDTRSDRGRRNAGSPLSRYCRTRIGWGLCDRSAGRYSPSPYSYENATPDRGGRARAGRRTFPDRRVFR